MSLQDSITTAVKNSKTEGHSTGKTPAFYNKRKDAFIDGACTNPVPEVRIYAAGSDATPTKNLKEMLVAEKDIDVLTVLLMNPRVPTKALEAFMDTPEAELFDKEDEVYQYIIQRVGTEDTEPEPDDQPEE